MWVRTAVSCRLHARHRPLNAFGFLGDVFVHDANAGTLAETSARAVTRSVMAALPRVGLTPTGRRMLEALVLVSAQHPAAVAGTLSYRGITTLASLAAKLAPKLDAAPDMWVGSPPPQSLGTPAGMSCRVSFAGMSCLF